MTAIFFYGTLLYEPLLRLVLGPDSAARTAPASLADHAVRWAEGESFSLIRAEHGARADGLLVTGLDAQDIARLDFYEGGFGYDRRAVEVDVAGTRAAATVYFPAPGQVTAGAPWSLADWVARWGAVSLRAAEEVMDRFGVDPPAEVARHFTQIRMRAASWVRAQHATAPNRVRHGHTAAEVDAVATRRPYRQFFQLEEQDLRFRRFDGTESAPVTRAAFVSADAVTVLPYDPARDRVLVIEQFRFGPFVRGDRHPWTLEPVAGRIDPGESPEDCARREAAEEAALEFARLEPVARYYPSPGAMTEYLFSYVGIADLPDGSGIIGGVDGEDEDIRGILMSFDDLMALIDGGEAENGPLILTAHWLAANRERLRQGT